VKAPHYIYQMYIAWLINYILIGFIFQWFMHYGTIKIAPQHTFIHKERIILILIWPVGVIGFIISFVKVFFNKNE
jgi:hypothetical protein